MEMWRTEPAGRPKMMDMTNIWISLGIHVLLLAFALGYAYINFSKDETIIPIDLTVVVNENLEGEENEPPPLQKPEDPPPPAPEPPKPEAKPKEPDPPKELEKIVTNIVEKVEKKEKPKEVKKPEKKKPEPPKKTAKELREERMKKMRENAKTVKTPVTIEVKNVPSGNGRTAKKTLSDAEIKRMLNEGYKPGTSEQLATSEEQRCISLVRMAFEEKWDKPPWTDTLKPMVISCKFGPGGKLVAYNLTQSSGDKNADQSILVAARKVVAVSGLSPKFIEKYRNGIPVRFTVKPQ